ncbi:interleukin 17a/f3 [Hippoglossus stenolepis]|uniref:interleukin 17a/f3 n=1 Tax=Hippoglossus stenolepis TaxID=195615 RepID=UPI00159C5703|nr:interleukin 17a/f3 [Hippoglossus stenolepis]
MRLLLRAFLMLSLATLLLASRKGRRVSVNFGSDTGLQGKMARLILDPSVLPQIVSTFDSSIANMSLSPWTYRDSYVESRVPRRISHAQCLTSGCLNLQGGGEVADLEAKPIHYQVLVLHRVPRQQKKKNKKGKNARTRYLFRLGMEVVSVGCTCVRPSVVSQR